MSKGVKKLRKISVDKAEEMSIYISKETFLFIATRNMTAACNLLAWQETKLLRALSPPSFEFQTTQKNFHPD